MYIAKSFDYRQGKETEKFKAVDHRHNPFKRLPLLFGQLMELSNIMNLTPQRV